MPSRTDFITLLDMARAIGESSRLRILLLLRHGELTVSDLTMILRQSQPRVSRHLKLLMQAGLVGRYQEGSWAYFFLLDSELAARVSAPFAELLSDDDPQRMADMDGLARVRRAHSERAAAYFAQNAEEWDRIRSLHAPDGAVEAALRQMVGTQPLGNMLDIGTGTGRMLTLFASDAERMTGIDNSREMLSIARARLDEAGVRNAQLRQADAYDPSLPTGSVDLVTIHQVLHYLDRPGLAVHHAARMLRAGGRLAIIDFQSHDLDFLREDFAHLRLGFTDAQIGDWLKAEGLKLTDQRTISPTSDSERLVVNIWLAAKV